MPETTGFGTGQTEGSASLGLALFQLAVREIDSRAPAMPCDLIAGLAWLAGRVAQGIALRESPEGLSVGRAANGTLFLRADAVSFMLASLETGSLAAALVDAALLGGSRRFPDLDKVRMDAMEAMERRGEGDLRGVSLSASPCFLAAILQEDVQHLLYGHDDRHMLFGALAAACAHAISYGRHRIDPAVAAELALAVAFHAGWVDQRKSVR
jgi:hypothetical protein